MQNHTNNQQATKRAAKVKETPCRKANFTTWYITLTQSKLSVTQITPGLSSVLVAPLGSLFAI